MELLKQLAETPGVPGRETRIREFIREKVEPFVDDVREDTMGNLICHRKPRPGKGKKAPSKPRRVMLAAHMDQIGFIVRYIDDKGFVRINNVGGFDMRNLFARRMKVCTKSGDLPAVMNPGGKPVHIASEEERKKVPEIHEFYLDLGLPPTEVRKKVEIGDMVVIDEPLIKMGDTVVSQALDDRIGCWVLVRALEKLKSHKCEIFAVFTVQEEVGLRGAGPAAFGVQPDVSLAIDTTLCCDTPGVSDDMQINKLGEGVALKVMDGSMISDLGVLESLKKVGDKKEIRYQVSLLPRGGTDSGAIQRTAGGVKVVSLACPLRNIHTVTEVASWSDIESYRDLVAAWLAEQ